MVPSMELPACIRMTKIHILGHSIVVSAIKGFLAQISMFDHQNNHANDLLFVRACI